MKPTVVRLTNADMQRIKRLIENGYATTMAAVIRQAIEDAYLHLLIDTKIDRASRF